MPVAERDYMAPDAPAPARRLSARTLAMLFLTLALVPDLQGIVVFVFVVFLALWALGAFLRWGLS
jgi:hypothetical protein